MFSSILRAQVSLAWVIGPPLAYALAMGFGFTVMYLCAAVAFVVCGAMVWFFLPSMRKEPKVATGVLEAPRRNRRDALLLFIICTLIGAQTACISLICRCLLLMNCICPKLAGIMMGTAAGLEIPTMLIAGYYAKRFGKRFDAYRRRRRATVLCRNADGSYAGAAAGFTAAERHLYRHTRRNWHALFRDLMRGQAGSATTLYTNTTRVAGLSQAQWPRGG